MEIYIEKDDKKLSKSIEGEISCEEILKELDISNESVLLVKNGNVCLEDETITDEDELKILSVVSGG